MSYTVFTDNAPLTKSKKKLTNLKYVVNIVSRDDVTAGATTSSNQLFKLIAVYTA